MTILVTGANGQLGNEMRIVAADTPYKYIFTDVVAPEGVDTTILDITDLDALRAIVREHDVKAIVNCAAYTNVDRAETDQALAHKLNADAPRNLATVMHEVGGLLIHISTDYVFGGDPYNTPCREDQKGTPTGVYGATKLLGEQAIIDTFSTHPSGECGAGSYIIIRTAWLYSEFGKNFVKTMLSLTATKPQLKVVFDQVGTPTYALDLARAIAKVLAVYTELQPEAPDTESQATDVAQQQPLCSAFFRRVSAFPSGIYHYSNEGVCSWFDFTKMIAEYSGNTTCDIQPCHSSEFPSPVTRPAYSVLDKTKIKQTFDLSIPYWTDSLRHCLANMR